MCTKQRQFAVFFISQIKFIYLSTTMMQRQNNKRARVLASDEISVRYFFNAQLTADDQLVANVTSVADSNITRFLGTAVFDPVTFESTPFLTIVENARRILMHDNEEESDA